MRRRGSRSRAHCSRCNPLLRQPYQPLMMKHVLLGIAAGVSIAAAASDGTLEETFDRTFEVRPGLRFTLENTNGHITVRSWDQAKVRVRAEKRVESRDSEAAHKAFANLKIEPSLAADGLHIVTRYPKRSDGGLFDWLAGTNVSMTVNHEITVPRMMHG